MVRKIPYIKTNELYYYAYLAGMFSVFSIYKQKEIIDMLMIDIAEKEKAIIMSVVTAIFAYENGEWEKVMEIIGKYGILMDDIYEAYKEAIACANELNTDCNKS